MTVTAFTGPIITNREDPYSNMANPPVGQPANLNPDAGPSMFHMAVALLDPRWQYTYETGQAQNPLGLDSSGKAINTSPTLGWLNATFQVADYAPGTASTQSLAVSASSITSSYTVALVTTNGNGVTTASATTNSATGAWTTGLWLIDSVPNYVSYGTGTMGVWDPANPAIGRCLSITVPSGATSLATTTFTISGFDAYGMPVTQSLVGPAANATVYTSKAFKWVSTVAVGTTVSPSTFSIGVADIYGLPFYATSAAYVNAYWNNVSIAAPSTASGLPPTTFTAGTATTATTTTSDVRGKIDLRWLASDGVKKLQMWQSVSPSNLTVGGLFGVTP